VATAKAQLNGNRQRKKIEAKYEEKITNFSPESGLKNGLKRPLE
jgi:hypothetical protein